MTRAIIRFALTVTSIGSLSAHAYEPSTHAILSARATQTSVLSSILSDYGLDDLLNVQARIVDGARLEDTQTTLRSINHFYNPRTGLGLSIPGFSSSPDWALAPRGSNSDQDRSYWDARQRLFDALTKPTSAEREENFAQAFRTLGHVLHHIQDMAQPQHVRSDMHCDYWACQVVQPLFGTPSRYEMYTQQREGNLPSTAYDVSGQAFTSVVNSPRRFWNTLPSGAGTPEAGSGLAEFTHSNFVSAGTNFLPTSAGTFLPRPDFPLPIPSTPQITEKLDIQSLMPGTPLRGEMWFIGSNVRDNITGQSDLNPRASTFSIFTDDLQGRSGLPTVRLNRFNFDYAHEYLIPRAVGYSTGMINYFFRAKIDLKKDEQDPAKFRVINLGPETMNGKFALYYDARDGNRYPVLVDPTEPNRHAADPYAYRLVIAALDPAVPNSNLSEAISITPPPDDGSPLSPKAANEYMLVFNGDMGEERADTGIIGAVAAKMVAAPYNSVLYILAADAANQRITLRVDKNGTRVVPATEFHPLRNVFIPTNIGQGLAKAYVNRQVKFTQHTIGYSYETLATSVGVHIPGLGASAIGWWKNPASGNFETAGEMAWTAKSSDPLIGQFRFRPILPESNLATSRLEVQRRYVDAAGSPQTVTTTIQLPPPPVDFAAYLGFVQGGLVVSPDGLSVSGFRKVIFLPDNSVVEERHDLRVELAEVPVLSFVKTGQQVIGSNTATITPLTTQTIATLSVGFPCLPNPVPTPLRRTTLFTEQQITNDNLTFLDYYNDVLHSYRRVDNSHGLLSYTETGASTSACNLTFIQTQGETIDIRDTTGGYIFSSGGVLANLVHSNESQFNRQNLGPWNRTWDFNYFGGAPIPPIPRASTETPATFTLYSDIFPIGPNSGDAVYLLATTGSPSVRKFRNSNVSNNFVGDASPIGEVFFAHTDLSLVVHEPKRGPQVQFPPNVVRLIAAMWM